MIYLSLSLCLHVDTAYRNGKKVYRTKVGKRTASSGSFCCFFGGGFKVNFGFFKTFN